MFPGFAQRLKNEFDNVSRLKGIPQSQVLSKLKAETNSLIHGMPEDVFGQVNYYSRPESKVIPLSGKDEVWNGGSILASLSTFEDQCITKEEYQECGPSVIHRRCF